MTTPAELYRETAALHARLCPRQVLGVRMGLLAGELLELDLPRSDKRMLAIVETDGCAVDGISVATGCRVGRRTLHIQDMGKAAATLVDTHTDRAVRIAPRPDARQAARAYALNAHTGWEAQLIGYQRMPADQLLSWQWVQLTMPLEAIMGDAGARVTCSVCQEEIINGRQVMRGGAVFCRVCAGQAHYVYYVSSGSKGCRVADPSLVLELAFCVKRDHPLSR